MNDLINELAAQAGAELYGPKGHTNICVNDQDADALMRKFAELIVEATLKTERERTDRLIAEIQNAAEELRRLHEVNQELLEALKIAQTIIGFGKEWDQIDAAIAKAEVTK